MPGSGLGQVEIICGFAQSLGSRAEWAAVSVMEESDVSVFSLFMKYLDEGVIMMFVCTFETEV